MSNPIHSLKLLIAEEDPAARRFLADNFTADGAQVETANNCGEALKRIYSVAPDLIIADVNGDTLRLIEKVAGEVPIIVLCSHDDETDRVRKLERGADDVITKPFAYYELRARAGAVMRRLRGGARRILTVGALRIDVAAREAWLHDQPVEMSAKEFAPLCTLASDRRACSPRTSWPARYGTAGWSAHAPWTATPADCGESSTATASTSCRTSGASAIDSPPRSQTVRSRSGDLRA